jgi:hypothetical protein
MFWVKSSPSSFVSLIFSQFLALSILWNPGKGIWYFYKAIVDLVGGGAPFETPSSRALFYMIYLD